MGELVCGYGLVIVGEKEGLDIELRDVNQAAGDIGESVGGDCVVCGAGHAEGAGRVKCADLKVNVERAAGKVRGAACGKEVVPDVDGALSLFGDAGVERGCGGGEVICNGDVEGVVDVSASTGRR